MVVAAAEAVAAEMNLFRGNITIPLSPRLASPVCCWPLSTTNLLLLLDDDEWRLPRKSPRILFRGLPFYRAREWDWTTHALVGNVLASIFSFSLSFAFFSRLSLSLLRTPVSLTPVLTPSSTAKVDPTKTTNIALRSTITGRFFKTTEHSSD